MDFVERLTASLANICQQGRAIHVEQETADELLFAASGSFRLDYAIQSPASQRLWIFEKPEVHAGM